MKRLAGLTALALVIGNTSGCGWLWGPEGYFRDRGDDYLGARETPPMQLPEGVHSKPLDPLLPITRARAVSPASRFIAWSSLIKPIRRSGAWPDAAARGNAG